MHHVILRCVSPWLTQSLLNTSEAVFAALPYRRPTPTEATGVTIVSHRGERDNLRVFENTHAAFEPLLNSGVNAIEFDVRWTADSQPVVFHDSDCQRLFGQPCRIADLPLTELQRRFPLIPALDECVVRYAPHFHLMIELKAGDWFDPARQRSRLAAILAPWAPARDFHILTLEPALFEHVEQLPAASWLPIARTNVNDISKFALSHGCAGFAGPYALIRQAHIDRHRDAGQSVGVGFPAHRNVLYREIRRGIRWIFSNHARWIESHYRNLLTRRY